MPLLRVAYRVACRVLPTKPRRIVFMSYPDAADNSWHLYRYMARHLTGYEFVWLCEDPDAVRERILRLVTENGHTNTVRVVKRLSVLGQYLFVTSPLIFCTVGVSLYVSATQGRTVVNLWHGMPIKAIGSYDDHVRVIQFCDYTLSTSPLYTKIMARAFRLPESHVLECGLPRNDALMTPRPEVAAALHQALSIPAGSEVIFWLPTYRRSARREGRVDSSSNSFLDEWEPDLLARLDTAARAANRYVLIKLHPLDRLNADPPKCELANVRLVSAPQWVEIGVDLYDALALSSALISDISSVLVDYVQTGKLIAATIRSATHYTRGIMSETTPLLNACASISTEEDLFDFVAEPDDTHVDHTTLARYNESSGEASCPAITRFFGLM